MKSRFLFSCFIVLTLVGCNKEPNVKFDTSVSNITQSSADISVTGSVSNTAKKYTWGFAYDTNIVVNVDLSHYEHPGLTKKGDFTYTLTGLNPSTTYFVRPFCKIDAKRYLRKEITDFTTSP